MTVKEQVIQSEYLSALLSSIDASVVATGADFMIEYWNRFAEEIFDCSTNEAMGKKASSILEFIYPNGSEQEARELLLEKGHWRGHVYYNKKSGRQILLDVSVSTVKNKSGQIIGYVGVHRDITDYDKIKANYSTLLSIFSTIDDNFFIVDKDLKLVLVDAKSNKKMQEYYGISYNVGESIIEKLPEHRRDAVKKSFLKALSGEKTNYEVNIHNIKGNSTWLHGNYFPIKEQDGSIVHACLIVRDITAPKEIELLNEKLYQSRRLFETFMENSPILSWISDRNGTIRYLNPAYLNTYHLRKEHIGKLLSEVFNESFAKHFRENDETVLQTNLPLQTIERGITPDNKEHIYKVMKFPLHMDNETFVAGWAIDLTEEILLRDSLNKSLTRLQQSQKELKTALEKEHQLNDLKSRFVSMASHEFRTPLSTMLSSAYLLEKYTTTDQQANRDKHIHKIRESILHMNSLLDDFLSLGKLEEGKTPVDLVELDVHELMQEIVEELEPLRKSGQTIHYLNGEPKRMITDKKLLKNILINVLSNAYKFSEENKNIWISCKTKNNSLQITVKDEGIGVSAQDQKHLFETFFRARNAQNIQGTGLGLHIIKRYAALLHGKIELESELDKGTTVYITLPLNEKA